MSSKTLTGISKRRIIPAIILVALVIVSGIDTGASVFARPAPVVQNLHINAISSVTQFSLTEWGVPTLAAHPWGIAVDQFGKVWVTENSADRIARFDPSNNNFTEWPTPRTGSQPRNIFVKQVAISSGNVLEVFFSEFGLNAIARFNVSNNSFTEWQLAGGSQPIGIYVDENNDIWFAESGRDVIGRIRPSSNTLTEWTLPGATTTPGTPNLQPYGIYVQASTPTNSGADRFVYFTESANNKIGRLEANSNLLTLWDLNSLSQGSHQPTDITLALVNSVPQIVFSNLNSNRISLLGNDTGTTGLSPYNEALIPTANSGPGNVAFDAPRKAIWFSELNVAGIANVNTTSVFTPILLSASYCTIPPAGGAACASPATETTSVATATIKLNVSGTSIIQVSLPPSNVGIYQGPINDVTEYRLPNKTAQPFGVAVDPAGNLWFTESNATVNRIGRLNVPYVFQLTVPQSSQNINRGQSATYSVHVRLISGSPSPVTLSLSNAPANVTSTFNPQIQNAPFNSTLTIFTTSSTATGTFSMTIQGTSGGQTQIAQISLTVVTAPPPPPPAFDYSILVTSPTSVTIQQGDSASYSLTITLKSGSMQPVSLNATGLPPGATYSFTNSTGTPSFSALLNVVTSADTPSGSYTITITGVSAGGVVRSPAQSPILVITEIFRDFNITSATSQVILVQGSRIDIPITVTPLGAFSGDVDFSSSATPSSPSFGAIFSPASVTVLQDFPAYSTMEIIALKNTVGTYLITVTATSSNPARSHQITISVRVSPCLIATATFGSELAPEVQFLRDFRDQQIMQTFAGSSFMDSFNAWYYSFSPAVAQYEYSHSTTRAAIKLALYPLMGILHMSSWTYALVGVEPEAAALAAGLVASSLIGLVYLGLPMLGVLWVKRNKVNSKTKRTIAKSASLLLLTLMSAFILSEYFALAILMVVVSAAIVLTVLFVASVLPGLALVEFARRRN